MNCLPRVGVEGGSRVGVRVGGGLSKLEASLKVTVNCLPRVGVEGAESGCGCGSGVVGILEGHSELLPRVGVRLRDRFGVGRQLSLFGVLGIGVWLRRVSGFVSWYRSLSGIVKGE